MRNSREWQSWALQMQFTLEILRAKTILFITFLLGTIFGAILQKDFLDFNVSSLWNFNRRKMWLQKSRAWFKFCWCLNYILLFSYTHCYILLAQYRTLLLLSFSCVDICYVRLLRFCSDEFTNSLLNSIPNEHHFLWICVHPNPQMPLKCSSFFFGFIYT